MPLIFHCITSKRQGLYPYCIFHFSVTLFVFHNLGIIIAIAAYWPWHTSCFLMIFHVSHFLFHTHTNDKRDYNQFWFKNLLLARYIIISQSCYSCTLVFGAILLHYTYTETLKNKLLLIKMTTTIKQIMYAILLKRQVHISPQLWFLFINSCAHLTIRSACDSMSGSWPIVVQVSYHMFYSG